MAAAALAASPLAAQQSEPAGPPDEPVGLPELKDFRLPRERPALPPVESQPAPILTPPPAQQPQPTPPAAEEAPARPAPAPRTFPRAAPPARQPQPQPQAPVQTAPPPADTAPVPAEPLLPPPPPVDTLPAEPQAEAPAPLPAPEAQESGGFNWLYLLLAALAGLGIFAFARSRSARTRRPERVAAPPRPAAKPAAPKPTPPPPAPSPAIAIDDEPRPRLQLEFRPARAAATADYTEVQYELIVRNVGALPAGNVLLEARMFNAGPELDGELAAFFAAPDPAKSLTAPSLPAMTKTSVKSAIRMPKENVREINVQGRRIFIPVVAFNLVYHWAGGRSGQTSQSFIVGREPDGASDKMGPFRLDLGPRVYRSVSQRPNKLEHVV